MRPSADWVAHARTAPVPVVHTRNNREPAGAARENITTRNAIPRLPCDRPVGTDSLGQPA